MTKQGYILIIDDSEEWRKSSADVLTMHGFQVEAVGKISKALEKLNTNLYHVLVLDIRMGGDDSTDAEGMLLLDQLVERGLNGATKVIMHSAYGTKEQMRNAFKNYEVADFLSKDEFKQEAFVESVRQVFDSSVKINLLLDVHWRDLSGSEQIVLNVAVDGVRIEQNTPLQKQIAAELEDLLCRLFYPAKSILVRPLAGGYSGTGVLRVQPFYATGGGGYEVIVKFGDFQQIAAEYDNFKKYVQPFLGGGRNTVALDLRRTPHLGGIVYSLLGSINDQLVDFGDYYQNKTITQIKDALDRLFQDTCRVWYANRSSLEPLNLTLGYQEQLGLKLHDLEKIVSKQLPGVQFRQQRLSFQRLRINRTFTNPWLSVMGKALERSTYRCITHGDFNQRNLLVDSVGHMWMLDFQGISVSHILSDVAALDAAVRFQLLMAREANLKERLLMEEALGNIQRFSELEQLEASFTTTNPAVAKCYATVMHLRKLARSLVEKNLDDDISEYKIALFYTALHTVSFSSLDPTQREHAILCASLLADQLKLTD